MTTLWDWLVLAVLIGALAAIEAWSDVRRERTQRLDAMLSRRRRRR